MRSSLSREWWFLLRDRQAVTTMIAAFLLAIVAVGMGLRHLRPARAVANASDFLTMGGVHRRAR